MRTFKTFTTIVATLALVAAGLSQPAVAATGPTFSWVSPNRGAFVSGVVVVEGEALAPSGSSIKQWCLDIDGAQLTSDRALGVAKDGLINYLDHNFDGQAGGATFDVATGCYNSSSSIDTGVLAIDTTAWNDGTYTFQMRVTDSLNRTFTSSPVSIFTENAAPTFQWLSPSNGSVHGGVVTFEATATPDPAGTASIKKWCLTMNGTPVKTDYAFDGADATFDGDTGCYNSEASIVSGKFAIDTTTWPDGLNDFQITATDSSNRSVVSQTLTVGNTNRAPKFQWMSPITGATHASTVEFSGLAEADPAGAATVKYWCLTVNGSSLPSQANGQYPRIDVADNLGGYNRLTDCFQDGDGALTSAVLGIDFTWLLASSERDSAERAVALQIKVKDSSGRESLSGILTVTAFLGQLTFSVSNNTEITPKAFAPTPQVVAGSEKSSAVSVFWSQPPMGSAPATGYVAQISSDGGSTWSSREVATARLDLTALAPSSATVVKVAVKTANGTGPFGASVVAATTGLHTQRLKVLDASGAPVSGGALTFAMKSGSGKSASALGLTSTGTLSFAAAPAGSAKVKIVGAKLADGVFVSGTTEVVFGAGTATIRLPGHSPAKTTFKPLMTFDSLNVAGVTIEPAISFRNREASNEFIFEVRWAGNPKGFGSFRASGITNDIGVYEVGGFIGSIGEPTVTATYDANRWPNPMVKTVTISNSFMTIPINFVPVISADVSVVTGVAGRAVNVSLKMDAFGSNDQVNGQKVTLIAPAGAKTANCGVAGNKAVLQGQTDTNGIVKLRICATQSGKYTFEANGALAMGSITLHVAKAKPMAVSALTLTSSAPGALAASWTAPEYLGGAKLSHYLVTLKPKAGGKSIVKKVTSRSLKFSKLAHATEYSVSVVAVTKYGSSPAVVGVGGVA